MTDSSPRALLEALYQAALARVGGRASVARLIEAQNLRYTATQWHVLAAGKAAVAMTQGAYDALGPRLCGGLAVTRDEPCEPIGPPGDAVCVERAGHPLPDERSVAAGSRALAYAAALSARARLLVLVSGGASSLWVAPVAGVTVHDKREITDRLQRAGAPIAELNAVRAALSQIKGGGLARAAGQALCATLAISDVAGDRPEIIGSGPTLPIPLSAPRALDVLARYGVEVGPAVRAHLASTPPPAPPPPPREMRPWAPSVHVVASLRHALGAVVGGASQRGLRARGLGEILYGEARELAVPLREWALAARAAGIQVLAAGGEPTVTVRGDGRGGRAQELALAFALATEDVPGIHALFAGTDGSDGATDAAGAYVDSGALARARAAGVDPVDALERNDSHAFHRATGGLVRTGPTGTNVTDLAILWVAPP